MSCQPPDCNTTPLALEPNPDISGIGVVLGFVVTAWGTFLSLALYYFIAPTKTQDNNVPHLLDSTILNRVRKLLGKSPLPHYAPLFENVVLVMSDQQLVTGLSIIISGYSQLRCGLSFYHWQMVTTLAWFSTITHLATLLFLQEYLQKHRVIWYVRALLMTGLGIMLAVGILPSGASFPTTLPPRTDSDLGGSEEIAANLPRAAICLFDLSDFNLTEGSRQINMIISQILLLGGLCIRVVRMFSLSRTTSKTLLVTIPGELWRKTLMWSCRRLETSPRWRQVIFLPITVFSLAVLVSMQCVLDFLTSNTCGILWLLFSLIWGTLRLTAIRRLVDKWHNSVLEENAWGFGQLVSVLLLLIPVLLIAEVFSELGQGNKGNTGRSIPGERVLPDSEEQMRLTLIGTNGIPQPVCQLSGPENSGLSRCSSNSSHHITFGSDHISPAHRDGNCSVFASLLDLCEYDFRRELWYRENLFLIITVFTGAAIGVLPAARWWGTSYSWTELLQRLEASIAAVFLIYLVSLCGILNSLDPKRLSQRHPLSIIRLVIDPGWCYRVSRWIYIFSFQVLLPALPAFPYRVTVVWAICLFSLLFTLLASFYSIYSQLVS